MMSLEEVHSADSIRFTNDFFQNQYITKLLDNQLLNLDEVRDICKRAREHYKIFPNIIYLKSPITIVGDLHGQDEDLMSIFRLNSPPAHDNRYLFLGDYINRGNNSCRIIMFMFVLSTVFKTSFFCLRGNHESEVIAGLYGFAAECLRKYGADIGEKVCMEIMNTCNYLPLAAVIDEKLFCVHGGLSPKLKLLDQIYEIERIRNIPLDGLFCDLMWSDPKKKRKKKSRTHKKEKKFWKSPRGAGCLWSEGATRKFLKKNKLEKIIRGHQVQDEGFGFTHDGLVITIFSASHYQYSKNNKGCFLVINEDGECHLTQYFSQFSHDKPKEIELGKIKKLKLKPKTKKKELVKKAYLSRINKFKSSMERKIRKMNLEDLQISDNSLKLGLDNKLGAKTKDSFFFYLPGGKKVDDSIKIKKKETLNDEKEMKDDKEVVKTLKKKLSLKDLHEKTKSLEKVKTEKTFILEYFNDFEQSIVKQSSPPPTKKNEYKSNIDDLRERITFLEKKLKEMEKIDSEKDKKIEMLFEKIINDKKGEKKKKEKKIMETSDKNEIYKIKELSQSQEKKKIKQYVDYSLAVTLQPEESKKDTKKKFKTKKIEENSLVKKIGDIGSNESFNPIFG